MMKMLAELPILSSSSGECAMYNQPWPPPAPPYPQLHPFYTSEFSSPPWFHHYNNFQYTAPQVFDEIAVRNPTHTPAIYTSPYTLTVQTTLSTGQPYFSIEPTTVFENVNSFVDLSHVSKLVDVCETDAKLESTIESDGGEENTVGYEPWNTEWDWDEESDVEIETEVEDDSESVIKLISEAKKGLDVVVEEKREMKIVASEHYVWDTPVDFPIMKVIKVIDSKLENIFVSYMRRLEAKAAKGVDKKEYEIITPTLMSCATATANFPINSNIKVLTADDVHQPAIGTFVEIKKFDSSHDWGDAEPAIEKPKCNFGAFFMSVREWYSGAKLQKKLEYAQVFVVGSGALGYEFLKRLALMGVSCNKQGKLTVIGDDVIEKSNLSRQFLFHDCNIGHAKSMVDATTTAMIDLALRIEALQNRGGLEIEKVFNDSFWENHSVVVNAYLSNTSEYTSAILNARIFEWKNNDVIVFFVEATSTQEIVIRPYWNGLTYLLLNVAQAAALDLGFVSELIAQGQARDRDWKSAPGLKPKSSLEIQQDTVRILFDTGWNQVMQDYCFDGASAVPVILKASMIIIGMNLNAGGSVHGLLLKKGFAGLSGAILSQIYVLINSPDSASLIFMVAVGPTMVVISLMFIVRPVGGHRQVCSSDGASSSFIYYVCLILTAYLMGVMLVEDSMDLNHIVIIIFTVVLFIILLVPIVIPIWLMFTQEPEDQAREALLTAPCREEPVITGHDVNEIIFSEVEDEKPRGVDLLPATERHKRIAQLQAKLAQAAAEGAVRVKSRRGGLRKGEDFTLMQALIKADFWLIFFLLLLGSGSGLTVIDNLGQMSQSLGYDNTHIFVSLISIWNFLGRVGGGYFSEIIVKDYAHPRHLAMTIAQFIMAFGHLFMAVGWPGEMYVGTLVIGLGYGVHWEIVPAAASELFGLKKFGALYNFLTLAYLAGTLIFSSLLASSLYDSEAAKQDQGLPITLNEHSSVLISVLCWDQFFLSCSLDKKSDSTTKKNLQTFDPSGCIILTSLRTRMF